MNHHIVARLRNLHRDLERELRRELVRPLPDEEAVRALKRRKLRIKDQLFLSEAGLSRA